MLSSSGAGYSRLGDLSITRWQPDPVEDRSGSFIFLRDLDSGDWWSATAEPKAAAGEASEVIFESYPVVGFNYRMTDIQAAVGREQLKRLAGIVQRRREVAAQYAEVLSSIPGLGIPCEPAWAHSNWQSYCVRLPAHCEQRAVMQAMLDAGISTRRGIMCSHREPAMSDIPVRHPLTHSEQAQDRCILLPLYGDLTPEEQQHIATTLRHACRPGSPRD